MPRKAVVERSPLDEQTFDHHNSARSAMDMLDVWLTPEGIPPHFFHGKNGKNEKNSEISKRSPWIEKCPNLDQPCLEVRAPLKDPMKVPSCHRLRVVSKTFFKKPRMFDLKKINHNKLCAFSLPSDTTQQNTTRLKTFCFMKFEWVVTGFFFSRP